MCMIIPKASIHVSDTEIFCAPLNNGTHQVTVYKNKVSMNKPVAMILPFPTSNSGGVRMLDLSGYETIFEDLKEVFEDIELSYNHSLSTNSMDKELKVFKVGSYNVSIASSFKDLNRLNKGVFDLKKESNFSDIIKDNYPASWGYVVCILRNNAKFHPIGYVHKLLNGKLFVPTRHYHGHIEENPDWDHEIYLYNVTKDNLLKNKVGLKVESESINYKPVDEKKMNVLLPTPKILSKMTIDESFYGNKDFIIKVN